MKVLFFFILPISLAIQLTPPQESGLDTPHSNQGISYQVRFEGTEDDKVLKALESVSQTLILSPIPPETKEGLLGRGKADIPNLLTGLRSLGYYGATIEVDLVEEIKGIETVVFQIETGPIYPLEEVEVELNSGTKENPLEGVTPRNLGLIVGQTALPKQILEAGDKLLQILHERGYLFATLDKRVVAKESEETIHLIFTVTPGPKVLFGETCFIGLKSVDLSYALSKLAWCEGTPFDPYLLKKTQINLEDTGLFSTIGFEHAGEAGEEGYLPFTILVQEAAHRTVGVGGSYNTSLGIGAAFSWEHRNILGKGQKLSLSGDVGRIKQTALLEWAIPDFLEEHQKLRFVGELEKERTEGFKETFYSGFVYLDHVWTDRWRGTVGIGYKQLFSSDSDNNNLFSLVKAPINFRYTAQDSILDPSKGGSLQVKSEPTVRINTPHFCYWIQQVIGTLYFPIPTKTPQVFAFKINTGSIIGPTRFTIPPPERFYAGSENTLRGYAYMTVSPLSSSNKPIGGESLFIFSAEHRIRITDSIGWVTFYEIGNVYSQKVPQLFDKQLQSWGIGLRYHTAVGPLRADFAFPMTPRPGIDKKFQVYLSIGQAF